MAQTKKWTARRKAVFLDVLRTTANVSAACRAAGVSRARAYQHRTQDKAFKEEWENAQEEALDNLEETLRRRAIEGIEKPVYYAGKECGTVVSYNDNLGMFLLKSRRRHIYGDDKSSASSELDENQSIRDVLLEKIKRLANDEAAIDEQKGQVKQAVTSDKKD